METFNEIGRVTVYVDPTCPFAWITSRWLREVQEHGGLIVHRELMSLSVVNEGRELDGWYREYNDGAWHPARIAAAVDATAGPEAWTDFYHRFGQRRHVEGLRDDLLNIKLTLAEMNLPAELAEAAEDAGWDPELRRRTASAAAPLTGDIGTPILHIGDRGYFGPVLTAVPHSDAAVRLWHAIVTIAQEPAFSEIKGARDEQLQTS